MSGFEIWIGLHSHTFGVWNTGQSHRFFTAPRGEAVKIHGFGCLAIVVRMRTVVVRMCVIVRMRTRVGSPQLGGPVCVHARLPIFTTPRSRCPTLAQRSFVIGNLPCPICMKFLQPVCELAL